MQRKKERDVGRGSRVQKVQGGRKHIIKRDSQKGFRVKKYVTLFEEGTEKQKNTEKLVQ